MSLRGRNKGRSVTTYQHKIKQLEKYYRTLFKASQKSQKRGKTCSSFFHEKYPTVESFVKLFTIKEATKG